MNTKEAHDIRRMLERFYSAYEYCLKNQIDTFQYPRETYIEKSPTEQLFIKVDFDDMVTYGLLSGYHRCVDTPFSFKLTKFGFNTGGKIDVQGIDLVTEELCKSTKSD